MVVRGGAPADPNQLGFLDSGGDLDRRDGTAALAVHGRDPVGARTLGHEDSLRPFGLDLRAPSAHAPLRVERRGALGAEANDIARARLGCGRRDGDRPGLSLPDSDLDGGARLTRGHRNARPACTAPMHTPQRVHGGHRLVAGEEVENRSAHRLSVRSLCDDMDRRTGPGHEFGDGQRGFEIRHGERAHHDGRESHHVARADGDTGFARRDRGHLPRLVHRRDLGRHRDPAHGRVRERRSARIAHGGRHRDSLAGIQDQAGRIEVDPVGSRLNARQQKQNRARRHL